MYLADLREQLESWRFLDDEECCALVFWSPDIKRLTLVPFKNIHKDRRNHFAISLRQARDFIKTITTSARLVAVFHTHIEVDNPDPSPHDLEELARMRRRPGYGRCYGMIYHLPSKSITIYTKRGVVFRHVVA